MTIHEQIEKIFDDNGVKGFAIWHNSKNENDGHLLVQSMPMSEAYSLIAILIDHVTDTANIPVDEFCDNIKNGIKLVREEKQ